MQELSDSVTENAAIFRESIRNASADREETAKRAAAVMGSARNYVRQRDPAAACGVAFAVFAIAEQIVERQHEAARRGQSGLVLPS